MRKIIGFVAVLLLLPLLVGAVASQASENSAQSSPPEGVDFSKPIEPGDARVVTKTTLPSASALSGAKSPPDHANDGGGSDDDEEESDSDRTLGGSISGDSYAIVIGIADYPGTDLDLKYTDDDANQVATTLINEYEFDDENITTLIDGSSTSGDVENGTATFSNIKRAVGNLSDDVHSEDEVVFFFSGHGGSSDEDPDEDGEITDESIIVHTGTTTKHIWDGQLEEWFSGMDVARITFGFDSCLAGGMDDVASSSRIVVAASNETSSAYEIEDLKNGQFTYYFFEEGMEDGNADSYDHIDGEKDVTVEEAYEYTDENYHPRYKKDGPAIDDQFDGDLLLGY